MKLNRGTKHSGVKLKIFKIQMISSRNTEYLINDLIFFFQIIFGNGVDRLSLPSTFCFNVKNF